MQEFEGCGGFPRDFEIDGCKTDVETDVAKSKCCERCRTGTIQPGDALLAINDVRLDDCDLEKSKLALKDAQDIVKLTIKKDENFAGLIVVLADVDLIVCSSWIIYKFKLSTRRVRLVSGEMKFNDAYL